MANKTILLVEHNREDEMLTLSVFKTSNLANEIVVVRDGADSLDFLFFRGAYANRDPQNMPETILLDLKLPKMDGLEVLRRIRVNQRTKSLPVIVLTASDADQDWISSYHFGAIAFIRKPVDFGQLVKALRKLAMCCMILNKLPEL